MTSFQLIRGSKKAPNTDVVSAALIAVLEAHNAALKADVEKLEAMLAAERESANTAIRAREHHDIGRLRAITVPARLHIRAQRCGL